MFDELQHPLYGKPTTCHACKGEAVWVLNGSQVGNYHYCRACKIETGPFAKDITLPKLEEAPLTPAINDYIWVTMTDGKLSVTPPPDPHQQLSFRYINLFDLTGDEEGLIGCQDDGDCEACEGAD